MIAAILQLATPAVCTGDGRGGSGIDDSGIKLGGSIRVDGKEVGGRTMANMPYVVGEKGPELFVPGKTGTVVPTDVFEATRKRNPATDQPVETATHSSKTPLPSAIPPQSPRKTAWSVRWGCVRMSLLTFGTSPQLSTTCLT